MAQWFLAEGRFGLGDMTDEGHPNAPIQLQIYSRAPESCRRSTAGFRHRISDDVVRFCVELDGVSEVPPNALDARIIQRCGRDALKHCGVEPR